MTRIMDERRETRCAADLPLRSQIDYLGGLFKKPFPITPEMLDRVHTWSKDDRPITLRQYVAAKASQETAGKLGVESQADESIDTADQLDADRLRKTVLGVFEMTPEGSSAVIAGRNYSRTELLEQLKDNAGVANMVIQAHLRSMLLIENMIQKGSVVLRPDTPIQLPFADKEID